MVRDRVLLAGGLSLGLQLFKLLALEDLLEAASAVVEELLAEGAELEVAWDRFLSLRFKVDFDNRGAKLTIEL